MFLRLPGRLSDVDIVSWCSRRNGSLVEYGTTTGRDECDVGFPGLKKELGACLARTDPARNDETQFSNDYDLLDRYF